jgi:hypothetical protein
VCKSKKESGFGVNPSEAQGVHHAKALLLFYALQLFYELFCCLLIYL